MIDPETFPVQNGMHVLVDGPGHCYSLYYFIPSITKPEPDLPTWMVFHRAVDRNVQLYALDLQTGAQRQLTYGNARESGWAIWCQPHLDGIYNHLSALNQTRREVFFFDSAGLSGVHLDSMETRKVRELPGRISIGQTAFSPSGNRYAFIHADERAFREALTERYAGDWSTHQPWREKTPCVVETIDATSGETISAVPLDFHVHHLLFIDEDTLLINHQTTGDGMWIMQIDGSGRRDLRPADEHGRVCHQVITRNGIWYESRLPEKESTFVGRYDLATDTWTEFKLPFPGYHHTGFDPAGERLLLEIGGERPMLAEVRNPFDEEKREIVPLTSLQPYPGFGQIYHGHPFLSPCREYVVFTACENGHARICAMRLP